VVSPLRLLPNNPQRRNQRLRLQNPPRRLLLQNRLLPPHQLNLHRRQPRQNLLLPLRLPKRNRLLPSPLRHLPTDIGHQRKNGSPIGGPFLHETGSKRSDMDRLEERG